MLYCCIKHRTMRDADDLQHDFCRSKVVSYINSTEAFLLWTRLQLSCKTQPTIRRCRNRRLQPL